MYSEVVAYIVHITAENVKSSIDVVNISSTVGDCTTMESDCSYETTLPMIYGVEEYRVKVVADTSYSPGSLVESITLNIGKRLTHNCLCVKNPPKNHRSHQ